VPGTLVIDGSAVRALSGNGSIVAAFPFLRSVPPPKRRGCCGGVNRDRYPDPQSVMRALMSLPPDRRAEFKRLAGVDTVTGVVVRAAQSRRESF